MALLTGPVVSTTEPFSISPTRRYFLRRLITRRKKLTVFQGLISNNSIHVGIRAPVVRPRGDYRNDIRCGFEIIKARDLDRLGVDGVVEQIKSRVQNSRVYISVDIDVLDPAYAPGMSSVEHHALHAQYIS